MSIDGTFRSSDPRLVWPRTDGNKRNWPEVNVKSGPIQSWYERADINHGKYKLYCEGIGKHILQEFYRDKSCPPGTRIDMPPGYALFVHMQPRENGAIREDFYLFGSDTVHKFRSVPEFKPHAIWLMNTKLSLDDHTACECRYNKISDEGRRVAAQVQASKRPQDDDPAASKRFKEESKYDPVVPERAIDFRTKRRYRKGELVWFRIETISPPAGSGLPEITHWPGLIGSITEKTVHAGLEAGASLSTAWTMFGGAAPETLKIEPPKRTYEHSIRALGMFSNTIEVTGIATSDILPWAAGPELIGGEAGHQAIGKEATRVLEEGVAKEAEEKPKPETLTGPELDARWKRRYGERIRFDQLQRSWDAAVLRFGVAMLTGQAIARSWSQTDRIDILPPNSVLTAKDIEAIENGKKTLFQGLWLRGERIWLDDMVILLKNRKDLPRDQLLAPSKGAEDRAVFLHIRCITLEVSEDMPSRQSTPALNEQEHWRCLFYGDLYELAQGDSSIEDDVRQERSPPLDQKAPPGYYYRRLNDEGSEVVLDVFDIAGRCYPDLFENDTAYFYPPGGTGRVPAGDCVMGLLGLRSGFDIGAQVPAWKDDLYLIVRDATVDVEGNMRRTYAKMLCEKLGYPVPEVPVKKNGSNGA